MKLVDITHLTEIFRIHAWIQRGNVLVLHRAAGEVLLIEAIALDSSVTAVSEAGASMEELRLSEDELAQLMQWTRDFLAVRRLSDGRLVYVTPLLFGQAQLAVSPRAPFLYAGWYDASWRYHSREAAMAALESWDPAQSPEPAGYEIEKEEE